MAKIVLVDPPFHRLFGSHYNGIPLGLCYISNYIKAHGHESVVYNTDCLNSSYYLSQFERMKNYDTYLEILNDKHNPIWHEIVSTIFNLNPDFVGISANTSTLKSALLIAKLIKTRDPSIKIVGGGIHFSVSPILHGNIDCTIVGEGETGVLEFLENPTKRVIKTKRIIDLDALPFPDREAILIKNKNVEYGHLITSRGCPYNCIFCASKTLWGTKPYYRSAENVLHEISHIGYLSQSERIPRCDRLIFHDDTFTWDKNRVLAICDGLKNQNYRWSADAHPKTLTRSLMEAMAKAGCVGIRIGIESGDDRILKLIKKETTKSQITKVVRDAKQLGLPVTGYFMVGLPTETDTELRNTIAFAKELNLDSISVSIATPYLGTELYDLMPPTSEDYEKFFHQSPEMGKRSNLSSALLQELFEMSGYPKDFFK